MRFILILVLAIISISFVQARPYIGEIKEFSQPDGSKVEVKLYGTELYMRAEGLDGYTVVYNKEGWICYATLNEKSTELIPTKIHYFGHRSQPNSLRSDLPMSLHLDITAAARDQKIKEVSASTGYEKVINKDQINTRGPLELDTLKGSLKGLTILIDFPDQPAVISVAEADSFMNQLDYTGFGNNGSTRTFYKDISLGKLDYQNYVFGYYHASKTFQYYDSLPYAVGAQQLLGEALNWIKSQGFDFSNLSTNPDGTIRAINMMYTGNPPRWAQGMWFHAGYYGDFSANGVRSGSYNTSPANAPLELGTVCHENGHMIGRWPDTYKYDDTSGPDGIGGFDLMCGGAFGTNPAPPNPYFTARVGWGKLINMNNYTGLVYDTANSMTVYQWSNPINPAEYYLFQARTKTGRSLGLPDDGITIWHIDENGQQQTTHVETYLVHANNNITDHAHACYRETYVDEFMPMSTPNSDFYYGLASNLWIWNISKTKPVMTYYLGFGDFAPYIYASYDKWNNDDNNNGYLEAGEHFDVILNIENLAPANSDTVLVNIRAVTQGSKISIANPQRKIPMITGSTNYPLSVNIGLDASIASGSTFSLEFTVIDSLKTQKISRSFIVGKVITMDQVETLHECDFIYQDPGGTGDYPENNYLIQTIYPSDPEKKLKVKFSEFNLESSSSCTNDYLEVLDGTLEDGISIGQFCGTNRPPVTISNSPTGALTFIFNSNATVQKGGWKAELSCETVSGNKDIDIRGLALFPNPTDGKLSIATGEKDNYIVTLFAIDGTELGTQQINGEQFIIDLSAKQNGIYLVRISSATHTSVRQIMLQR